MKVSFHEQRLKLSCASSHTKQHSVFHHYSTKEEARDLLSKIFDLQDFSEATSETLIALREIYEYYNSMAESRQTVLPNLTIHRSFSEIFSERTSE